MDRRGFLLSSIALAGCGMRSSVDAWRYGVWPSGADQSAQIQALINNTTGRLNFLGGTYIATGLVGKNNIEIVTEGRAAIFQNASSAPTSDAPIFKFQNKSRFAIGGGITLAGNAATWPAMSSTGPWYQHGLVLDGCDEFKVEDLKLDHLNGYGIEYKNAPVWWTQADFSKIKATNCVMGFFARQGGEHVDLVKFWADHCHWGLRSDAGNQTMSHLRFFNNSTGMQWRGAPDANEGHSTLTNVIADHNGYALSIANLGLGLEMSACQLEAGLDSNPANAAGDIYIYNSKGVVINASQIGCRIVIDGTDPFSTGAGNRNGVNTISSCHFRNALTGMAAPATQNGGATPNLRDNTVESGSAAAYNN